MQKLYYISSSTFPSTAANSVQVIKMCEEFSKKYRVTLYGKHNTESKCNVDEIFEIYGCKKVFEFALLSTNRNLVYSIIVFLNSLFFIIIDLRIVT